jgi:hypothetical protein
MPKEPVEKKTKTRRQLWEDNYNQVLEYAKRTGNLNLPTNDAETARLAGWLGRQKKRKDISNAEREKLAALQQYGYVDDYNRGVEDEVAWNEHFDQLIEYRRVVGRKVVSKKDCPKLSEWAARQRKMEKQGRLSNCRKQRLLEIGFVFRKNKPYAKKKRYTEEQENNWDGLCEQLRAFKEQHGHCMVTYSDEKHQKLATWVAAQRAEFCKGSIDETRKRRLDELSFTWTC